MRHTLRFPLSARLLSLYLYLCLCLCLYLYLLLYLYLWWTMSGHCPPGLEGLFET